MTSVARRLGIARPDRGTILRIAALLYVEGMLTAGYVLFAPVSITDPLVLVYPWVWIDVGLLAIVATTVVPSSPRRRRAAIAVGIGYFVLLAGVGGLAAPARVGSRARLQRPVDRRQPRPVQGRRVRCTRLPRVRDST